MNDEKNVCPACGEPLQLDESKKDAEGKPLCECVKCGYKKNVQLND